MKGRISNLSVVTPRFSDYSQPFHIDKDQQILFHCKSCQYVSVGQKPQNWGSAPHLIHVPWAHLNQPSLKQHLSWK